MAENEYENALGLDLGLNGKILSLFILIGSKKIRQSVHRKWDHQQQQQHSLFSQASWGRLEMKPERSCLIVLYNSCNKLPMMPVFVAIPLEQHESFISIPYDVP